MGSLKDAKLDWSGIKPAKAIAERDGQRVKVFLTKGDYSAKQMGSSMMSPVKSGGEPILVFKFSNGKDEVVAGDYDPAAGFNKPFWVLAEVRIAKGDKGTDVSLGLREGKAIITQLTEDKVCGTFDLKSKSSKLVGEFVATLEK